MWSRFEGIIVGHSAKAILFQGWYWEAPVWLPTSQTRLYPDEDSYVVDVRDWLTEKRGILEFTSYTEEQLNEAV